MLKFISKKRIGDKMNKKAFTVAEILVTLAVIGVVATLTLPQLAHKSQKRVYASKLSTAVSDIENVMTTMLTRENHDNLKDTPAWTGSFLSELEKVFPHKKVTLTGDEAKRKKLNGKEYGDNFGGTYQFITHKGVLFGITTESGGAVLENSVLSKGGSMTSLAGTVYIDSNGEDKPNMWGRDTFIYYLDGEGHLHPYGGKDIYIYENFGKAPNQEEPTEPTEPTKEPAEYDPSKPKKECVTNKNGKYCAAYLAGNGYDMDY